jgi:LacI family transcriptional regulator
MGHITINDLARRLGISASTVSRALRNHPDISDETKARVMAAATAANYQPNLIAQSLQTRRSNNLGVIVPEIRNTFFSNVISGIEEVAYQSGYTILVCQSNDTRAREEINIRALAANRVAGMLVSVSQETESAEHLQQVIDQGVPLVLFDRIIEGLNTDLVVVDDLVGARAAVTHLIERGRRAIAHLAGAKALYVSRKRQEGYQAALMAAGLPVNPEMVVHGGYHEEDGWRGAEQLLSAGTSIDAIFAINDPVALGALFYCQEHGIRVPEDVAIVGFSNNPNSRLVRPQLTTVNQPATEMGKTVARMLLERLEPNEIEIAPRKIVLKTELIIRASS